MRSERPSLPCALTIGGLDPGGGAGILADLRAFAAANAFGCAAVTLTTAQSTAGLKSVRYVRAREVASQAEEVLRSQRVCAVKVGALGSRENVHAAARLLLRHAGIPVVVDTPMLDDQASTPEEAAAIRRGYTAHTPMLRLAHPDELADAALFLASDESSFMTGSDMVVDGGVSNV